MGGRSPWVALCMGLCMGVAQGALLRLPNRALPPQCSDRVCIPKCCPMGRVLHGTTCAPAADGAGFDSTEQHLSDRNGTYYVVLGHPCPHQEWIKIPSNEMILESSGQLKLYDPNSHEIISTIESQYFCLETWENETEAVVCTSQDSHDSEQIISVFYTFGLVSSVVGLLLGLAAFLTLRDLHGQSFICHAGCEAVAYVILLFASHAGGFSRSLCSRVNFSIRFFLLSSFLWLHVMCLDAFWGILDATESSHIAYPMTTKPVQDSDENERITGLNETEEDKEIKEKYTRRQKSLERRAFIGYSIYAWFLSFLPIIVIMGLKLSPTIPALYLSHSMELHCEFNDEKHEKFLLLFYLYIATFISFNTIIFICIAIKALRFIWNTTDLHRFPKQKARVVFLLFVLTSANWLVDLIAFSLNGEKVVLKILQGVHITQGLMTFFIVISQDRVKFVITQKLWYYITKKCKCCSQTKADEEEIVLVSEPKCSSSNEAAIGCVNHN